MIINWYQWFFWKIVSFGLVSFDLGPLFKVIYLGTYGSRYFNLPNVASSVIHFFSEITGNFPTAIRVSNSAREAGEDLEEENMDLISRGFHMTKQIGSRLQTALSDTVSGYSQRGGVSPRHVKYNKYLLQDN